MINLIFTINIFYDFFNFYLHIFDVCKIMRFLFVAKDFPFDILTDDVIKTAFDFKDYGILDLESVFHDLVQITIGYADYRYIKSV